MENPKIYRKALIRSCWKLADFHDKLFDQLVNLAMSGEMSDADELFDVGDDMNFKLSDFEKISDANVQRIIGLLHQTKACHDSLVNTNNLKN
ncbi:hypothetical protein P872_20995 [Rhodonellum psychrophilum GCM71 = DSM 17998]|uniref:Uncharacterized protein n=2 Tax=Rhodonellum TaxID=336827 RepID=U5BS98_9BACT|nr:MULTISPECIES: hypothetical protein [Rhodonellum]ERM80783.1 hypothetical protein P872_20995 [Rhodonellum psychrophilum GCM71 = DSM 17998]SDZ44804.1 hypothetical protein SAMN05444412_11523 [Rhodonellum ikkaensis]